MCFMLRNSMFRFTGCRNRSIVVYWISLSDLVVDLCVQVVDWILGPGEKLLGSPTEIGNSYRTADDLRKQHEQLELKCAVSGDEAIFGNWHNRNCFPLIWGVLWS